MTQGPLKSKQESNRRHFLKWLAGSATLMSLPGYSSSTFAASNTNAPASIKEIKNVFHLEALSRDKMGEDAIGYLNGGADDLGTVKANTEAYKRYEIRARRLVDVRNVSTRIELFDQVLESPIILAPVGFQAFFHPAGEVASAKAAKERNHQMIVSSVSNFSVGEIASQSGAPLWFQLYPTPDRRVTKKLLQRAENAGCKVCALTVDTPVLGNREQHGTTLVNMLHSGELKMGNFEGILPEGMNVWDSGMAWEMVGWLKRNCAMKVVLKGIVTHEDAKLAKQYDADGIIVSNHGGRQLDSGRATIDCLPEIVEEIDGAMPVLIDGGIRRGTDIFKALGLGADAVCIGRPFCWGLGALGQEGVALALEILQSELVRDMQLAGTTSIEDINQNFIIRS